MSDEIGQLRTQAKRAYLRYHAAAEGAYTIGNALLQHVSPDASEAARQFDAAMIRLRALDPNCPAFTPLTAKERSS